MIDILKKVKVFINYVLDRIIDQCNLILMDVIHVPFGQSIVKGLARFSGDLCVFFQSFPKSSVYSLKGKYWKIIYIGDTPFINEILALFFPGEKTKPQLIKRVPVWQVGKFVNQCLRESADLVIYEESRIHQCKVKFPVKFSFPEWINQRLSLPESLEGFLSGTKMRNKREQIIRAEKYVTDWYYSQSEKDFKFFHYYLYQPYITSRHKSRALLSSYGDQYERWFKRGGLVMVTENDEPLAGSLCIKIGNIVYAIEMGIEEEKKKVSEYSINTFLIWAVIQWSIQQKASFLNLGGSRAYAKNGSFRSKKRWGSEVVRRSKIFRNITCMGENLPQKLREHINSLGFITEDNGKFFKVFITPENIVSLKSDSDL